VQELAEEPDDMDAADFEERIQEPLQEGSRQDDHSPEASLEDRYVEQPILPDSVTSAKGRKL